MLGQASEGTQAEGPFCIAFNGKRRVLNRAEYFAAVERTHDLDLLIDITQGRDPETVAGRRGDDGAWESVALNLGQGEVLARAMVAGRPRRPAQLRPVGRGDHHRYVDEARARIDRKRGKSKWDWFKTVGSGDEREIHFNPDPKVRHLLLCRADFIGPVRGEMK